MATTYTLIDSAELGSSQASIEFTSISSAYTDLLLVTSLRSNRSEVAEAVKFTVNSSTSSYSGISIYGTGSGTGSENNNDQFGAPQPFLSTYGATGNTTTSNTFSNMSIYIPNYLSSNYKSISIDYVAENNATFAFSGLTAGLWSNTAAITSVKLAPNYGTSWLQYSSAYLYGIKNS
jgi:hypothetical protein